MKKEVATDWDQIRLELMGILQEEADLEEIVRLVGVDALSLKDRLTLETARSIREDYLHQNAFHEVDTYTSMDKQYKMTKLILAFHHGALKALEAGAEFSEIINLPIRERIGRAKYVPGDQLHVLDEIMTDLQQQMRSLAQEGGIQYA